MGKVLTTGSEVLCGPAGATHGGNVAITSSAKLKVGGNSVLTKDSVMGKTVSGCANPVDNSGHCKCPSVLSVSSGEAAKLFVGGKPVVLESLAGATVGNPVGNLKATAKQNKLETK